MHSHHKSVGRHVTMPFVQRFAVVGILVLAFAAAPLGVLCSSCCPEAVKAPELGQAMPCCDEGCSPSLSGARSSSPAVAADRIAFRTAVVFELAGAAFLAPPTETGSLSAFLSPSPPPDVGSLSSVLRL